MNLQNFKPTFYFCLFLILNSVTVKCQFCQFGTSALFLPKFPTFTACATLFSNKTGMDKFRNAIPFNENWRKTTLTTLTLGFQLYAYKEKVVNAGFNLKYFIKHNIKLI